MTTTEIADNLLARLESEPWNRTLIGIAHDALLEAGREKEAEELECRCWLKAKGRKVSHWTWANGYDRFCFEQEMVMRNLNSTYQVVPDDLTNSDFIGSDPEECINEIISNWIEMTRKRKDELWLWEPPT